METSRDSYLRMFELGLSKEKLFEFGIKEMILVDPKIAVLHWNELKRKFYGKEDMYIRSAGRQGSSSNVFIDFYAEQFEHKNIKIDPTNNYHPRRLLANFTDFSTRKIKNKILLKNYQISHVFGRTKNPLAFCAPWNIVYIPKVMDPFTGHEAKGDYVTEFTNLL